MASGALIESASSSDYGVLLLGEDGVLSGSSLALSSLHFGSYSVPSRCLVGVTAAQIARCVGRLVDTSAAVAGAAVTASSGADSSQSQRVSDELDSRLQQLTCGSRLRADMPVVMASQLASLVVKCWTYLVWMHCISHDQHAASVTPLWRDELLWLMMRPVESTYSTTADIHDNANRNAKCNIRKGLRLTALLLSHPALLTSLLQRTNVTPAALLRLANQHMTVTTVQQLIQRAATHATVSVTKNNVHALLTSLTPLMSPQQHCAHAEDSTHPPASHAAHSATEASTDALHTPQHAVVGHCSSHVSSSAHCASSSAPPLSPSTQLPASTALSPTTTQWTPAETVSPSLSTSSSAPHLPPRQPAHLSDAPVHAAVSMLNSHSRDVPAHSPQAVDEGRVEKQAEQDEAEDSTGGEHDHESDRETMELDDAVASSDDESDAVQGRDSATEHDSDEAEDGHERVLGEDGQEQGVARRTRSVQRAVLRPAPQHQQRQRARTPAGNCKKRARRMGSSSSSRRRASASTHLSRAQTATAAASTHKPRPRDARRSAATLDEPTHVTAAAAASPSPPPTPPTRASAMARLSSVTFRSPDTVRGCGWDDAEHDLFCQHHRTWRTQAIAELQGCQSLQDQWTALCDGDQTGWPSRHDMSVHEQYRQLAVRWGERIQFIAPLDTGRHVSMADTLSHVALEPAAHDSALLYTRDGLHALLDSGMTGSPTATTATADSSPAVSHQQYEFADVACALRLSGEVSCKYWVFASEHERDEPGGNSEHMLAVYRLFAADVRDGASFDTHSGIDSRLPLDVFLRLGCMLVVALQTEGSCVYVPSAVNNECAHLVTTVAERSAVSVAGNLLNPRHTARLVRQHEEDGPDEAQRLEWVRDFCAAPVLDEAAVGGIDSDEPHVDHSAVHCHLRAHSAATISAIHSFLSGVQASDGRYQPEYYRQSWIPDLFSTSQACHVLHRAMQHDALPAAILLEQLLDEGRVSTTATRHALAATVTSAAAAPLQPPPTASGTAQPHQRSVIPWYTCHEQYGCASQRHQQQQQHGSGAAVLRVYSIKRAPVLLPARTDNRHTEAELSRHVHAGVTQRGAVSCNSFTPVLSSHGQPAAKRRRTSKQQAAVDSSGHGDAAVEYDHTAWQPSARRPNTTSGGGELSVDWMQSALRERGMVYLTDIVGRPQSAYSSAADERCRWAEQADVMVSKLVGERIARGWLLRHCSHHSPGVHSPSFFALFGSRPSHFSSPHHNEPHRVAAWHLLLRRSHNPTSTRNGGSDDAASPTRSHCHGSRPAAAPSIHTAAAAVASSCSASATGRTDGRESSASQRPVDGDVAGVATATAAAVSAMYRFMAARSELHGGSEHYTDGIDEDSKRHATARITARELYPNSVSLAFGELTKASGWSVLRALGMTGSSRLLDVGSAYGRFVVHAVLAAPSGASATGIEVCYSRAALATHFLDELSTRYSSVMRAVRGHVTLLRANIVEHLSLLFVHSHVFMFDMCFTPAPVRIIAHLLSYMSGVDHQRVISCHPLHKYNGELVQGEAVLLRLSGVQGGGAERTAHVYSVDGAQKRRHAVEVFVSAAHGLGVRAMRTLRAGQTIIGDVAGERVEHGWLAGQADVAKREMWPYLTRLSDRHYLYAWDISRYINRSTHTGRPHNVELHVTAEAVSVLAVRDIRRGDELLRQHHNWQEAVRDHTATHHVDTPLDRMAE